MGKSKRPPLTAVEIAELSSGASTERPDGLYWASDHLRAAGRNRPALPRR